MAPQFQNYLFRGPLPLSDGDLSFLMDDLQAQMRIAAKNEGVELPAEPLFIIGT
jgi:hypothetical protein